MSAPENIAPSLIDAALAYAAAGVPVFPCRETNKRPYTDHGFKEATTDAEQIRLWWAKWPAAMIGMPTGAISGVSVLDIDDPAAFEAACPIDLPVTRRCDTGKGYHLHFVHHDGIRNKQRAANSPWPIPELPGAEVRGEGGYVILPPSRHPSGQLYRWANDARPAIAPDDLVKMVTATKSKGGESLPPANSPAIANNSGDHPYCAAALDSECEAIRRSADGAQESTLNAAALKVGHYVGGGCLDHHTARNRLLSAALAMPSYNPRDPWTAENLSAKIDRALQDGMREPKTPPEKMRFGATPPHDQDTGEIIDPPARSFDELLADAQNCCVSDMEAIEALLAEAAILSPVRQDQVQRAIKDATGIPLGTLRQQARGAAPDEPDHLDMANMTLDTIGRENVICAESFVWMWQAKGVWQTQEDRAIMKQVQCCIDREGIDVLSGTVKAVTEVLKTDIFKPGHQFNRGNPESVNCENGELELIGQQWQLKPHCRENYRTTQIPVAFDRSAKAVRWMQFLDEVFRDDEDRADKVQALHELIGYTLMCHARHEKFVMLIGPGANGKSVALAVLEALLGAANVAGVQPSNFDRSFQRAHLHQKLANIVTELRQGEVIADAELKAITSGEPATVEHKFKDPFVMRPFATCWFGTNHMPHTRDFSEALFRRAVILQFNRTFAKDEQDPLLKDKLIAELPGILNLALDAYAEALQFGFTNPASSEAAKREWRLEADQVAQFVDDCCEPIAGMMARASDVFTAYQNWAQANGIKATMSQKGLRERLTRLGFGSHRDKHARYITGLQVRMIR